MGCIPSAISLEDIRSYFSVYGTVSNLQLASESLRRDKSILNNAVFDCASERMMNEILNTRHVLKGVGLKMTKYKTEDELMNYIDKSKKCRIYLKRLPSSFTNESL